MDLAALESSRYLAAFLVGLLGGVHCLGMCGGIVSALGFSQKQHPRQTSAHQFSLQLSYNLGRILSYVVAGALAGGLGAATLSLANLQQAQVLLQTIAALFMIALGLYLGGFWHGVGYVEKAGISFWKGIEPLGRRFMPVQTISQALPFGMVWGWLPCGLVYSILIWCLSAGSILEGALLMLAFGLGTLPNLLIMGALAQQVTRWTRKLWVKRAAGLVVIGFGWVMLWRVWQALAPPP